VGCLFKTDLYFPEEGGGGREKYENNLAASSIFILYAEWQKKYDKESRWAVSLRRIFCFLREEVWGEGQSGEEYGGRGVQPATELSHSHQYLVFLTVSSFLQNFYTQCTLYSTPWKTIFSTHPKQRYIGLSVIR
jgi:hypothetical protein